jgi:hypothetical protein
MAKLITMFFILIAIQAMILVFYNPSDPTAGSSEIEIRLNATSVICPGSTTPISCAASSVDCGCPAASTNALWGFITNIKDWGTLDFVLAFVGLSATLIATGIIAGSVFGFKTDFIIFAGAISGIISIGSVFVQLASIIMKDINTLFTDGARICNNCGPSVLITALIVGPFAFYYFWTVLDWWRGRDGM